MEVLLANFSNVLLVISYAIVGGGLKYIDSVYDEYIFNKRIAFILSLVCGALMGWFIAFDKHSAMIFAGIIFGVGMTNKIDNFGFYTVTCLSFLIPIISYIIFHNTVFLYLPLVGLILLIVSSILDEKLDEIGDEKNITIYTIRPFMKVVVILLWIFNTIGFIYVIAFFAFETGYTLVALYGNHVLKEREGMRETI